MPKIAYIEKKFQAKTMAVIDNATAIIAEYSAQGFTLTVRQLYYQMVARAMIPNTAAEYKRIVKILTDARLAGLIDWYAIEDRTRTLRGNSHWTSPQDIVTTAKKSYLIDKWKDQDYRLEVWIEKDALVGVIASICHDLDVNYFSCRGYTSISAIWKAAIRLRNHALDDDHKQDPVVIHLADHDPSGIDMTRDARDRLDLLTMMAGTVQVERIALNHDQVEQYSPPPNFTKMTDSRAPDYVHRFGYDSWELDALEPQVIVDLIESAILEYRDEERWADKVEEEELHKEIIQIGLDAMPDPDDYEQESDDTDEDEYEWE